MAILKFFSFLLCFLLAFVSQAQETSLPTEPESIFVSNGKFYVSVAVLFIIFAGIVVFLFILENQLKSLEKKINQ